MVFVRRGGEFRVNSVTNGTQLYSDVAELAGGGFVVVWDTADSTTLSDIRNIKAQRYDASGNAIGGEFLVNTQTASDQSRPRVTGLADGRFVVTWSDDSGFSDNSNGASVQAQIFSAAGAKIGPEFTVNTQTTSIQTPYGIEALGSGGFVVSWFDLYDHFSVKTQIYDASGAKIGGEITVDSGTEAAPLPRIATFADGGFVLSWNNDDTIWMRLYDAAGTPTAGRVQVSAPGQGILPDIAALKGGGYVVTWNDKADVRAQMFDAAGAKVETELLIDTQVSVFQTAPSIAALNDGGFVIAWPEFGAGSADGNIRAQAFDFAGVKIGAELSVNTNTSGDQSHQAIAALGDGFVVTWADDSRTLGDTSSYSIKAQVYRAPVGTPGDDVFTATTGDHQFNALGGSDTITFSFRLTDATVNWSDAQVIVDGPSGHVVLTGFERFVFTDGTIENNDGNRLVDDLFYYSRNHDVWSARIDAEGHFNAHGWREGRDPSAFFDTSFYLAVYQDVKAAGLNPLDHFDANGWREGRLPSLSFDPAAYRSANPDVAAAGLDPLAHFLQSGHEEGRAPVAGRLIAANGFDYGYYLDHNSDVAAAGIDPLGHYQQYGWKEGRNPNALFDTNGYLATYIDVQNGGSNPLDHYHQFGWKEGRDPSTGFDTTSYRAAYPDVAAAQGNPLVHYLQFGQSEGRQSFADGVWG